MSKMEQDVQQIIEKHMPKQFGDVLHKRFNELEAIEDKYKTSQEYITQLKMEILNKNSEIDELQSDLRNTNDALEVFWEREASLIKRENEVKLVELRCELLALRLEDFKDMTKIVFKNSTVKKVIHVNEDESKHNTGQVDNQGNNILGSSTIKKTEEVTEEE